ncbi:hypothetical protein F2Q68_00023847 [Brassica cretica]|uniref:Ribose-phosphate pyrophosphokinase N-terminal domain-containing protein n=1 Tax=Brassica cretica TaxID=69181 RepID=A0A8S9I7H5_BRACR|nr:hypothetical protein F2Q68_00023847 [Brassica cretica]
MSENAANNNNIFMEKNQICKEAIVSELQKKKVHLFYCLECEELARNIAAESDHITLQSINWSLVVHSSSARYRLELPSPCIFASKYHNLQTHLKLSTQKVLAAHGAAKVSAYVTHGVFPNSSWERFTHKNNGVEEAFAYFWITDSCPQTVKSIGNKAPFEVLSLAGSIADALQI